MAKFKFNGLFLNFLAGILWGTISISVRNLNKSGMSSFQVIFLRGLATVVLLSLYMLIFNRKLFKIRFKDIWCFFGTGVVSVLVFTFFHFYTMTIASVSFETVMMYTAPFFVIFISAVIFKEKITFKKIIACILAFFGCALVCGIFSNNSAVPNIAILTGLGAGLFYALYTIFSRFAIEKTMIRLQLHSTHLLFQHLALCFLPNLCKL